MAANFCFCPVANIKDEILCANKIQQGHRHFRQGAKLYILHPFSGGDGYEHLNVLALPKKSGRLIKITIKAKDAESFRLKKIFDPNLIPVIRESWGNTTEEQMMHLIEHWEFWSNVPYSCKMAAKP